MSNLSKLSLIFALISPLLILNSQIILDPTATVEGSIGLQGEVFGSGYGNSWANGKSFTLNLDVNNGYYSVPVLAGSEYQFSVYLRNFADTNSAQLRYRVYNQPALAEGDTRVLDLNPNSGVVVGTASVNGGATIDSITMETYGTDSTIPIDYYGYVDSTQADPSMALQPFPVMTNARAYATVRITLPEGCQVTYTTNMEEFDVLSGQTTFVNWPEIDASILACPTGDLVGVLELENLGTLDAIHDYTRIHIDGPASKNAIVDPTFQFLNIPTGNYYSRSYNFFQEPYDYFVRYTPYNSITIQQDETTLFETYLPVGTAHVLVETNGTWSLQDTHSDWGYLYFSNASDQTQGWSYDNYLTNQMYDFVVPAGPVQLRQLTNRFYSSEGGKYRSQFLTSRFQSVLGLSGEVIAGASLDFGTITLETSEADVTFQAPSVPGEEETKLNRIQIYGNGAVAAEDGSIINRPYISIDGQNQSADTQSSLITVRIRGLAGDYDLYATAYDTLGHAYTASFPLSLGAPANTPAGNDVPQQLLDNSGEEIASIVFDNVTSEGTTTISQVGTGPDAPANFAIFKTKGVNGNTGKFYYDIITTAEFDGQVMVCINYDDTGMTYDQEIKLELGHYMDETGTWDIITTERYPDENRICGLTDSFSLFAGLVPNDTDGDGVIDAEDNCPDVFNPGQEDTDGDGIGDVCETDTDGDGIDDDTDLCPFTPSPNNNDMDGDGIGDVCDEDIDGDGWLNEEDNCPEAYNPDQFDFDYDGIGDVCDPDIDGDGISNADDFCPFTPPGVLITENGCSSEQLFAENCPPDAEYKNHGEYVSCVAQEAEYQVSIGLITEDEKGDIIAKAAKSDIGKKNGGK